MSNIGSCQLYSSLGDVIPSFVIRYPFDVLPENFHELVFAAPVDT